MSITLNSAEAVLYVLLFVVPGFIWHLVVSALTPRKTDSTDISFLRFFNLSCVNAGIWSWLIYILLKLSYFESHPVLAAFAWGFIILGSPVLLGLISGKLSQVNAARNILKSFGIHTLHPTPTAWDYLFSTTQPLWILVTLMDGTRIAGYFGTESFASSDPEERDLFVDKMYRIPDNEQGAWEEIPNNAGVWIRGNEIRYIEFWEG